MTIHNTHNNKTNTSKYNQREYVLPENSSEIFWVPIQVQSYYGIAFRGLKIGKKRKKERKKQT